MSRLFGEIRQLGFVVNDIHAAMRHWVEVHQVGPWFLAERIPVENFHYKDQPAAIEVSVALANSGPLQVELIQQRNDAPSVYRDFIAAGRTGLQHVAYWTRDFDADMVRARAHGLTVIMSGKVGANGRYVYFAQESHPGSMIELSEIAGPKGVMFRLINEAAASWDGSNPVRPFPNLADLPA
jgi:catechol 2,3-dioxygenase-like lactoylglutathione lyase family enzyme